MGPTCILPGGQYWSVDPDKGGEVAQSMGAALGLSEFKVTTPLAQGTRLSAAPRPDNPAQLSPPSSGAARELALSRFFFDQGNFES